MFICSLFKKKMCHACYVHTVDKSRYQDQTMIKKRGFKASSDPGLPGYCSSSLVHLTPPLQLQFQPHPGRTRLRLQSPAEQRRQHVKPSDCCRRCSARTTRDCLRLHTPLVLHLNWLLELRGRGSGHHGRFSRDEIAICPQI
jgi:hypothetical protein